MARTKGAFNYDDFTNKQILNHVSPIPKTTHQLTTESKKEIIGIHYYTIRRILEGMFKAGKIRKEQRGIYTFWST